MNFPRALKTLCALGLRKCFRYALYFAKVRSGWIRLRETSSAEKIERSLGNARFVPLHGFGLNQVRALGEMRNDPTSAIAGAIAAMKFFPYHGTVPKPLILTAYESDRYWTEVHVPETVDVKDLWEPARFGFASELARAYIFSGNIQYLAVFRALVERFALENPPFRGVQAQSAQEMALRLIQISFAASVFAGEVPGFPDSIFERMLERFAREVISAVLARRDYAIAQNNNHWLSETAGLMTAAVIFPSLPESERAFRVGWRDFQTALKRQLLPDGEYVQYSANYHRLALQLTVWVNFLIQQRGVMWDGALILRLRRTVRKLSDQVDEATGAANNVGHNDGANLFAFGAPYADYRPTVQAAARIFLGEPVYAPGPWDELSEWLNARPLSESVLAKGNIFSYLDRTSLRLEGWHGWASLRASAYKADRPAHSDQLHVSIWREGQALVLDAGTFRYNGASEFENRLKYAALHNGVVIDGREPLTDAGKFLWLDWASARILENGTAVVSAEVLAFRRFGAKAVRRLSRTDFGWRVADDLDFTPGALRIAQLNWLVPDGELDILLDGRNILIQRAGYKIRLTVEGSAVIAAGLVVIRNGQIIRTLGNPARIEPERVRWMGVISPTYAEIHPAISFVYSVSGTGTLRLITDWIFESTGATIS